MPRRKPDFDQWLTASVGRYLWFLCTIALTVIALTVVLAAAELILMGEINAEVLSKPSVVLFGCASINLACLIRCWRTYKRGQTTA